MSRFKHWKTLIFFVLMVGTLLSGALLSAQDEDLSATEQRLIQVVAESEEFADWLALYEGWQGYAYPPEDGDVWYVEFYNAAGDEWLGYAAVDAANDEVIDALVPRPLLPDELQAGKERIELLVLNDPEVLGWLGDPILWYPYIDYNRYERKWYAEFYRGTDAVQVIMALDEEFSDFTIEDIRDKNILSEEEAFDAARNEAITLAYGAEGVDTALAGYDNWTTYAENYAGPVWSIEFVADESELFYALVNVDTDQILESAPR